MRGRQAKLTHMLGIMTRATLRFGSPFPHRRLHRDMGEDSLLERLRPSRRRPELCPRGHNPQAFLSRTAAVPHPLQDHLRDGRGAQKKPDNTGVAAVPGDHTGVEGVRGKQTMGVQSPQHLVQAVAILWCRELVSFVHREPHVGPPCPLAVGAMESAGPEKKMDAGATGTQVAGEQTTRTSDPAVHPEVRPLLVLPLHVGVLQCLLSTKPLVRSKCQESLEEVQGFWGGVWRQEGVQRLPWPAGSRLSSPL